MTRARAQLPLLVTAIAGMLIAFVSFTYVQLQSSRTQAWIDAVKESQSDAAYVTRSVSEITAGIAPDFETMELLSGELDRKLAGLRSGNAELGLSPLPGILTTPLAQFESDWGKMKLATAKIFAAREPYTAASSNLSRIATLAQEAVPVYEQIATRPSMTSSGSRSFLIAQQLVRLERMRNAVSGVLGVGEAPQVRADAMDAMVRAFMRDTRELAQSADAGSAAELNSLLTTFAGTDEAAAAVKQSAPALSGLLDAAREAGALGINNVTPAANDLQFALSGYASRGKFAMVLGFAAAGVAMLALIGFIVVFMGDVRGRLEVAEARDAKQQQAILSLLDEITNLADGDLTVDVTVTEDFTGAIADSINYTVDTLRRLVGTITDTSVEIAAAASSTQDTAQKMNQASERQARDVTAVSTIITQTSQSLQQVASRAEQLAADATSSVQIAHNGAQTVGRTIQGMAALREQIQDTAKRIKRLGESSQEIGNIIEFINDIAEQTNTLALNASIQAAMAGEAGRGFAVVADEVQRLAERAGSATRQIETLVKTIQADTNETIISMERSTGNVIAGAKSAEEAGQALTRIESSSTELARLIQEISGSARSQSVQTTKIAGQMQAIRDIAIQTSGSAGQTASAVGELTTLSEKLRESVAGFKLPTDVSFATGGDF